MAKKEKAPVIKANVNVPKKKDKAKQPAGKKKGG